MQAFTIVVPAYNNPEYTKKTLNSVLSQNYRPLNLVLVDDHSPSSLAPLAYEFRQLIDNGIRFDFHVNTKNLSADNYYVCYTLIKSDWCMFLHHDDELTDPAFISECMELIKANPKLVGCYGNAVTEKNKRPMVRDNNESWQILEGPKFIKYILQNGHTAWSSIVFKQSALKFLDFPRPPFLIDNETSSRTGLDCDEGFSTHYLLSMEGDWAVTGKVVAQRGEPESQFSRSDGWKTTGNSMFFIYYGIYNCLIQGKYENKIKILALISTLRWGLPTSEGFRLNTMLKYYNKPPLLSILYFIIWIISKSNNKRRIKTLEIALMLAQKVFKI
ncbi:glycosyltransferase family 2 protein [Opitutales bacterium]|jgi:glycosyltransferase involved in cell wall biosynthesis|nr:glycosyltransferase family 2 protein [Opitutales bacterium]